MAVVVGEAAVRLRPEASRFGSEAEAEIDGKLPGVAKKAAGYFAAAFAVVGVGAFLKNAVTQASDLGESASKVGVVFGDAADTVTAFAETASTSLGLSEAAALGAAGTFGNLLRSVGLTETESAKMSTSMIALAGDLASFNNVDPTVALDALRSGLVGETEPLKAFGVNMNEAALSAKAVELGLAASGEQLDSNAKAQAAYALIMEQTSLAQGDFGRTSAGLANQQRIVTAQFQDLSANVGGLLVPTLGNAAGMVSGTLMPALLRMTTNLPELGDALGAMGDAFRLAFSDGLGPALDAYSEVEGVGRAVLVVAANLGDLSAVFREAFVDGAVGSANLGASGLLGFATTAGDAAFRVREAFSGVWDGLVDTLGPVLASVQAALGPALAAIGEVFAGAFGGGGGGSPLTAIADGIGSALAVVGPMIATYVTRWAEVFQAVLPAIVQVVQAVVPVVVDLFQQIGPVLAQLAPVLGQVAGIFATVLLQAINALMPVLPMLLTAFAQIAQVLAGAFLSVLQALMPVLPVLVEAFAQVAAMLAGTFAAVLAALVPVLPPIVEALAAIAAVLAVALAGALQAIIPIIPTLVGALLALVEAALMPLLPLLPMLAELLLMVVTALAPLIPPIIQVVMLLIQLAVAALVPLLPIFPVIVGLIGMLLSALMPIIGVIVKVIGAFVNMAAMIISVVVGFVSMVIGAWTSLVSGITSVVSRIASGAMSGFQSLKEGVVGIFSGIADFIGSAFEGIGGAIKGALNAVIGGINSTVIAGLNVVIDGMNVVNPFDDIPHIPNIPSFHVGGVVDFGAAGEGLALLRNDERVATPEQRAVADNLLASLLDGDLPAGRAAAAGAGTQVTINEHIHAVPGESAGTVAARASAAVVWNLSNGIRRRAGLDALEPALR